MLNRGYKKVAQEKARREQEAEKSKGRLWRIFFPKDADSDYEIPVTFLTDEPVNFHEHDMQRAGKYVNVFCTADENGEGCTHCSHDKPRFKSAWLVFDHRPFEVDERDAKGNKTGKKKKVKGNVKVLVRGITDATLLDRKNRKQGLLMNTYNIFKTGTGSSTVWNYEFDDESSLTLKEIESILPESLRGEEFKSKGKLDFYAILEHQITSTAEDLEEEESSLEDYEDELDDNLVESTPKSTAKKKIKKPVAPKRKLKR